MLLTCLQRRRKRSLAPPRARRPEELFLRGSNTPFGKVTTQGDIEQNIQWGSEYHAPELALVYYKPADGCKAGWTCAQHAPRRGEDSMGRVRINPADGRWTRREPALRIINLYQLEALIETLQEIGQIALAQQAARELAKLRRKNCKPCIPPAGSRFCLVASPCSRVKGRHKTDTIGHVKVWIVRQDNECGCHLNFEEAIENTTSVPPNCIQIYEHPKHDIVTGGGIV